MHIVLAATISLTLAAVAGCAGNTSSSGTNEPGNSARLVVENRASIDMDIYARRQEGREIRVGFAPSSSTTVLELPPGIISGTATLHFVGRPVRRQGRVVVSELFNIARGEEATWSIPPQ
jgi:hypothetical protein